MSGRYEWRRGDSSNSWVIGDQTQGAPGAEVVGGRRNAFHVQAWTGARIMGEGPIPTCIEAQQIAEAWLDARSLKTEPAAPT